MTCHRLVKSVSMIAVSASLLSACSGDTDPAGASDEADAGTGELPVEPSDTDPGTGMGGAAGGGVSGEDASPPDASPPPTDAGSSVPDAGIDAGSRSKDASVPDVETDAGSPVPDASVPMDDAAVSDAGQEPDGGSDAGADGGLACVGTTREQDDPDDCFAFFECFAVSDVFVRCTIAQEQFRAELFQAILGCHTAAVAGGAELCDSASFAKCFSETAANACVTHADECEKVNAGCSQVTVERCNNDLAAKNQNFVESITECFTDPAADAGANCEAAWVECNNTLPAE